MELYPIYDENSKISKNVWYSISAVGESPFMRVGHTISYINNCNESKGKFYIIGGANPSGSFNDVYVLNMDSLNWDKFDEDLENFQKGTYEHSYLISENKNQIFIFGGCNENGVLKHLLKLNLEEKKFELVKNESQNAPSARTLHVGVSYKNQLIVYGGGSSGKSPVIDQKLYIYNPNSNKWVSLNLKGSLPDMRQGHIMLNYNDNLVYLHGGMKDDVMYEDLWSLDLKNMTWSQLNFSKESKSPGPRAAHGGIVVKDSLYIFGGIDKTGNALDDLWRYDINSNQWSQVEIFGYKPPARLDFAYCKADFKSNNEEDSNGNFLVIHGGMDCEGNIFDDMFIISLE